MKKQEERLNALAAVTVQWSESPVKKKIDAGSGDGPAPFCRDPTFYGRSDRGAITTMTNYGNYRNCRTCQRNGIPPVPLSPQNAKNGSGCQAWCAGKLSVDHVVGHCTACQLNAQLWSCWNFINLESGQIPKRSERDRTNCGGSRLWIFFFEVLL